jgi:hypothetical protein
MFHGSEDMKIKNSHYLFPRLPVVDTWPNLPVTVASSRFEIRNTSILLAHIPEAALLLYTP